MGFRGDGHASRDTMIPISRFNFENIGCHHLQEI